MGYKKVLKKLIRLSPLVFMIMILQVFTSQKTGMHMDEYFTYALAGHTDGTSQNIEDGVVYDRSIYEKYLFLDKENKFDLQVVWKNQENDVHPPLYYMMINALCSVIPGSLGTYKMAGVWLNIFFAVILAILLYLLYDHFLQDDWLSIGMAFFSSITAGMIENVCFIRMYGLLTVLLMAFTYLLCHAFQKKRSARYYLGFFLLALAGFLTHYYSVVYLFFISVYFEIHLMFRKRWRECVYYMLAMESALLAFHMIFPSWISHILSTNRGTESTSNLLDADDLMVRVTSFFKILDEKMFGGFFLVYFMVVIGSLIAAFLYTKKRKKAGCTGDSGRGSMPIQTAGMLLFTTVAYFLFVSKSASYMEARYIFPIFGLASLCLGVYGIYAVRMFNADRASLVILLLTAVLSLNSIRIFDGEILYREEKIEQQRLDLTEADTCVVIYDQKYRIVPSIQELMSFEQIIFAESDNISVLKGIGLDHPKSVIFVEKGIGKRKVFDDLAKIDGGVQRKRLFKNKYMTAYF